MNLAFFSNYRVFCAIIPVASHWKPAATHQILSSFFQSEIGILWPVINTAMKNIGAITILFTLRQIVTIHKQLRSNVKPFCQSPVWQTFFHQVKRSTRLEQSCTETKSRIIHLCTWEKDHLHLLSASHLLNYEYWWSGKHFSIGRKHVPEQNLNLKHKPSI